MSRGITELKDGDKTWTFDFGLPGWMRVEKLTGKKMGEVIQLLGAKPIDATILCQFVQGALQRFHPDITLDEAGDIATNLGDELTRSIEQALAPDEDEVRPTQSLREAS